MLEKAGFEKGGQAVVLGGATIAGFFAAACSLPFDFVKTRIQKMEPLPDGTMPYKGPVDCAMKTFSQEGFLKFYTGFPTYCVRYGPYTASRCTTQSCLCMSLSPALRQLHAYCNWPSPCVHCAGLRPTSQ